MGYEIIYGYDHWRPAVDTFNHNFSVKCQPKNILDFKNSIDEIDQIPDTEVIIGSPPCVSFSSSNKSGNADKSLGVDLTETFLRIVAVKKHQPHSILKAWLMENVVNSKKHLPHKYTFSDLDLADWAKKNGLNPLSVAINLNENSIIINSADYGSFQARKRVISGELIPKGKLIIPEKTHCESGNDGKLTYRTLSEMKKSFKSPFEINTGRAISDPQYPLMIDQNFVTDHFYDTGIYQAEWKFSKF